ncbi:SRPBCC family protein [Streptosporangium sandarakinum]|uniref:Uncharacterized protein YndB with AHSA1/START domain n=1 Tax=Streptosporangium sandarakinum TaxID=1260955 RepID=A0A852URP9_9ACTN|nr:SRPBCC domain-containing protein [Streptosporangium sandarakinum]NYF39852.1 uncharacterized protein YndB with AHSA1/START domain [Streptosporangium sandarakinum]
MLHEFDLRKEITLPATPEEVWEAIATGPGIDSWFMGRNEVLGGEGGSTRMTLGGMAEGSTITAWEPGKRFAHRGEEAPDGRFMAFEYLIEGRDGGSTVLRLAQHGFLGDDWEAEYEAMQEGWDMYLHTLAAYLLHFPGRTATAVVSAFRPGSADQDRAWSLLTGALGLPGDPAAGDPARVTVDGLAPVEGVVDYAAGRSLLGVRTADGLYRFIHSGPERGDVMVLGHHLFAPDADAAKAERAWQDWLTALFS